MTLDLCLVVFTHVRPKFWHTYVITYVDFMIAVEPWALDIFKSFDRVWHVGLLYKRRSYRISGQIFGFISSFLSNRRLRVVLDGKSSPEYPQGSILGPTLFLPYINDLPDDVICNIAIYADDTTLYSKCHQASDLWQQLELASELESNLRDTVDSSSTLHMSPIPI